MLDSVYDLKRICKCEWCMLGLNLRMDTNKTHVGKYIRTCAYNLITNMDAIIIILRSGYAQSIFTLRMNMISIRLPKTMRKVATATICTCPSSCTKGHITHEPRALTMVP